jgi:hypothetical protein
LTRRTRDKHERNANEAHELKPSDTEVPEEEDKACPALWAILSRRFGTAMVAKSVLIAFSSNIIL